MVQQGFLRCNGSWGDARLLRKVKFVNPEQCVPPDELTTVYQPLGVEAGVVGTVPGHVFDFQGRVHAGV